MPILNRTQLSSSDKLHLLAESSACQAYGDISRLSVEFNVSRKVIYKSKQDAQDILSAALGACPRIENLLRKSYFGQVSRSFLLNRRTICLK